mmetsp:Transcript_100106/g.252493  ORF Transcript_100106/g.252493 Transcript_100106/m.252493 type:complete len:98 (+) Transcript_100106:19-312(+)
MVRSLKGARSKSGSTREAAGRASSVMTARLFCRGRSVFQCVFLAAEVEHSAICILHQAMRQLDGSILEGCKIKVGEYTGGSRSRFERDDGAPLLPWT